MTTRPAPPDPVEALRRRMDECGEPGQTYLIVAPPSSGPYAVREQDATPADRQYAASTVTVPTGGWP